MSITVGFAVDRRRRAFRFLQRATDEGPGAEGAVLTLASSTASQESFERKQGDLSAMTYFLVRQLEQATAPGVA